MKRGCCDQKMAWLAPTIKFDTDKYLKTCSCVNVSLFSPLQENGRSSIFGGEGGNEIPLKLGSHCPRCYSRCSIVRYLMMGLKEHSHKILTKQQGQPCYLGIWCNPCSDQERCQAGRASLSCSDTEAGLGETLKIVCVHCV